jgi:tetratricopeptide (TPR) repeat protein
MREAGIGRVLVASLHQGIADILPTRLGFYENWLNAEGLRGGTIGLAPLYAVLSFLRQEGDAYQMITSRAGEYAAEWTVDSMSPLWRATIRAAPAWLRGRMLLGLARQLVRRSYKGSRAVARVRRGTARIDLRASIFCTVREPVDHPLCGFYAAAFTRLLTLFNLTTRAEVVACRGTGEPICVVRIALAVLSLLALAGPAAAQAPSRILVMPFENVARDSRIFWLTEAAAVLLADNLNALGASAITREERRAAFDRLQVPPAAALTDATVIRIGQIVGASQVVVGTLHLEGETLSVRAKSIALDVGRIQSNTTEGGPLPDLFAVFERLARRIAPSSAQPAAGGEAEHPPIGAFENYIKGLLAETPATAIGYLNAALQASPAFARPRLALWDVYAEQGDHERALAAVRLVTAGTGLGRRARFLAGLSQLNLKRHDEAFATYKALLDERPTAAVLNNLGVVQLRRGATPQTGQATYYFTKAAEAARNESDYFFNLGYAYWLERNTQGAIYWLREAVRRDPADGDAHFVLGAALSAAGYAAEAKGEKELARRLSSSYEELEKRAAPDVVPGGLERIKSDVELPHAARVEETLAAGGQRDQRELARFYLDRGRRLFDEERDRDALQELNRTLFLSPYEAQAHLLVGRIHLRGGRIQEAIDALKISLWSEETAEAHAVLGEAYVEAKDHPAARAEAARALALDADSEAARRVLERAK